MVKLLPFNGPHVERKLDASGQAIATTRQYMTPSVSPEEAIRGQPVPHPHFHRSLSELLSAGFRAGLVLDALEEPAFPPAHRTGRGPNPWGGAFSEFPAVLMGRLKGCRLPARMTAQIKAPPPRNSRRAIAAPVY